MVTLVIICSFHHLVPHMHVKTSRGRDDRLCNYCQGTGHWKDQCPVLRSKSKHKSFSPALACSSVSGARPVFVDPGNDNDFKPFIADAVVSLAGSEKRVPVKLLRDTGAKHSFNVASVLPFSSASETGDFILMQGMVMEPVPVPWHNVVHYCALVQGAVAIGVWPALTDRWCGYDPGK